MAADLLQRPSEETMSSREDENILTSPSLTQDVMELAGNPDEGEDKTDSPGAKVRAE
jgi:hypothetical protein